MMVCQTRPYETSRFTVGWWIGIYPWAGRVFQFMRVRQGWFVNPAPTRHRDLPLGGRLEFTLGRGGFSRLCVVGKDGLSNPPLRDIAKLWNIRRQPFGTQLFNS